MTTKQKKESSEDTPKTILQTLGPKTYILREVRLGVTPRPNTSFQFRLSTSLEEMRTKSCKLTDGTKSNRHYKDVLHLYLVLLTLIQDKGT